MRNAKISKENLKQLASETNDPRTIKQSPINLNNPPDGTTPANGAAPGFRNSVPTLGLPAGTKSVKQLPGLQLAAAAATTAASNGPNKSGGKDSQILNATRFGGNSMDMTRMNHMSKSSHNLSLSTRIIGATSTTNGNTSSTMKYLSNSDPIDISPSEIVFKDIQVNQTYEIQVFVRNLTKTARRIRVFQPQSAKFRVDYDMKGAIAAGLAMKLTVTFETQVLEDYRDSMKIVSDNGYEKDIPLHAAVGSG